MNLHYEDDRVTLWHGDCIEVLSTLPDSSVDAVVCDPPYGLANTTPAQVADTLLRWVNGERDYLPQARGFMGASWDGFVPPVAVWDECMRVLKPGGHMLVFAGSRTQDLMGLAIRLAGFDIRDSIAWLYGSGFPKSLDVSKAIDKRREEDLQPAADVAKWLVGHMEALGISRRDICDHFEAENIAQQWMTHWTDGAVKPRVPRWEQWQELRRWLDLPDDMDAEVWRLNGRKGKPGDNFEAREVLSERVSVVEGGSGGWSDMVASGRFKPGEKIIRETAPATPDAERWQGWGTALKPAFEPVVVARKPLTGTVAANVLQHGTGALNVDACRVEGDGGGTRCTNRDNTGICRGHANAGRSTSGETVHGPETSPAGRWPANVVLDDSQAAELDEQSGERPGMSTQRDLQARDGTDGTTTYGRGIGKLSPGVREGFNDTGGASRFFPTFRYEAKATATERPRVNGTAHPTVKPLDLMRWLVRLVTPPGGTVLEPFGGSGTTVEACIIEGFRCIAIEREADYLPLITQRIHRRLDPLEAVRQAGGDLGLFDLGEPAS